MDATLIGREIVAARNVISMSYWGWSASAKAALDECGDRGALLDGDERQRRTQRHRGAIVYRVHVIAAGAGFERRRWRGEHMLGSYRYAGRMSLRRSIDGAYVSNELYAPSQFILHSPRCLEPTLSDGRVYDVDDFRGVVALLTV